MDADREPWERQRGEWARAFEAFAIYRDMGPKRSIRAVAEQMGRVRQTLEKWSVQWHWVERAAAWDAELDRLHREQAARHVTEMHERHAHLASAFLGRVVERLQTLSPYELTPSQLIQWFETAIKVERQASGLTDDQAVSAIRFTFEIDSPASETPDDAD